MLILIKDIFQQQKDRNKQMLDQITREMSYQIN
jgi:hypothetical protein